MGDDIMQKFIDGPKEDKNDLNDFLKKVDDISKLLIGSTTYYELHFLQSQ